MRRLLKSVLVVLVACGASAACAGPLDKTAASKINGDAIGHPAAAPMATVYGGNAVYGGNTVYAASPNRSFSYAPAPAAAPAPRATQAVPAPPVQAVAPQATVPQTTARRYSYQPPMRPMFRAPQASQPSYLRLDRKATGNY